MGQYDSLEVIRNDEVLEIRLLLYLQCFGHRPSIIMRCVWVCGVLKNVFVKIVQQNGARQGLSAII